MYCMYLWLSQSVTINYFILVRVFSLKKFNYYANWHFLLKGTVGGRNQKQISSVAPKVSNTNLTGTSSFLQRAHARNCVYPEIATKKKLFP